MLFSFTLLVLSILHSSDRLEIPLLTRLEAVAYDYRLRFTMPGGVDPRIVIIDLDESSIEEFGWPWERDRVALLTEKLFQDYGVETLGFDIVFSEPDADRTLEEIKQAFSAQEINDPVIEDLLVRPSRDEIFANAIASNNVILGYSFGVKEKVKSTGRIPAPVFADISNINDLTFAPEAKRFTANLDLFQSNANGGGYFTLLGNVDQDGVIRRVSLLNRFRGQVYESFALATARNYLGTDVTPVIVENVEDLDYAPLEAIDISFSTVLVDAKTSVYVPYRGPQGSYRYISAKDVLDDTVINGDDLFGTIALLGTSATGLVDLRSTPVQGVYPGVEVHANIIAGLLDGTFKRQPEWAQGVEFLVLLIVGVLLGLLLPSLSALWMTISSLLVTTGVLAGNYYIWEELNFILPLATTLVLIFGLFLFHMIYGFFSETKSRMALKKSFGLYVPPEIVDEMNLQEEEVSLNSERREMTVLFTDVRDFTTISESLDPQALSELMNSFLTPMTQIVHEHRGAIDKYMGDAMMAFWGAPLKDDEHALHCVEAAMSISSRMDSLNEEFSKKDWPQLRIGVGICTGSMSVGNMGSEFRMAYTVLGDAVNLGARLEGLTKQYGVEIIVSQSTADAVSSYRFRELDRVRVKGKLEPITIYEPVGVVEEVLQEQNHSIDLFGNALDLFHQQKWDAAKDLIEDLNSNQNHKLYEMYLERIENFKLHPPGDDWDGVYTYTTK